MFKIKQLEATAKKYQCLITKKLYGKEYLLSNNFAGKKRHIKIRLVGIDIKYNRFTCFVFPMGWYQKGL